MLVRASLENPYAVIVAALAIVVTGIVSYSQMVSAMETSTLLKDSGSSAAGKRYAVESL